MQLMGGVSVASTSARNSFLWCVSGSMGTGSMSNHLAEAIQLYYNSCVMLVSLDYYVGYSEIKVILAYDTRITVSEWSRFYSQAVSPRSVTQVEL